MNELFGKIVFSLVGIILVSAIGIWLFWEQLPFRLIWPYIAQTEIQLTGEVQKITFTGDTAGKQTFFIYLPEGYESNDQQYRVLYHLHGAGIQESWAGYDCQGIGGKMEEMVAAKIIDPMIIVCPVDPIKFSMWSDSKDGKVLASAALVQDLIPYVDNQYRTIASKDGRAIQGFSMGGFGSAVAEAIMDAEIMVPVTRIGVPDELVDHATPDQARATLGLSAPQIAERLLKVCQKSKTTVSV